MIVINLLNCHLKIKSGKTKKILPTHTYIDRREDLCVYFDKNYFLPFTFEGKEPKEDKIYYFDIVSPVVVFVEKNSGIMINDQYLPPLKFGRRYCYMFEFFSDNEELQISHVHISFGDAEGYVKEFPNQKITIQNNSEIFSFFMTEKRELMLPFDNVQKIT